MTRIVKFAQSFGVVIPTIAILACVTTGIIAQEEQKQAASSEPALKESNDDAAAEDSLPSKPVFRPTAPRITPQTRTPNPPAQSAISPATQQPLSSPTPPPGTQQPATLQPAPRQSAFVPKNPVLVPMPQAPVRDRTKAYSEIKPPTPVANAVRDITKPTIILSCVVVQQIGNPQWKNDFVKNNLFGLLTRQGNKNPINTLSDERLKLLKSQFDDEAFRTIARPELRVHSGKAGSFSVSFADQKKRVRVISLSITATASKTSEVKLSVEGGVTADEGIFRRQAIFQPRTIISEREQPVFVFLESAKDEPPTFALISLRVFKGIKTTPVLQTQALQTRLVQPPFRPSAGPRPTALPAVPTQSTGEWTAIPAQRLVPGQPIPPQANLFQSKPVATPYRSNPNAVLPTPRYPANPSYSPYSSEPQPPVYPMPLHSVYQPQPAGWQAMDSPSYPPNLTPSVQRYGPAPYATDMYVNCGAPSRTAYLMRALSNLKSSNSPKLIKLVEVELKKSQIADIQKSIKSHQAQIKGLEENIHGLEASIRQLDPKTRIEHTLHAVVLQMTKEQLTDVWKKAKFKALSTSRNYKGGPQAHEVYWPRGTLASAKAEPMMEAFRKLSGVKSKMISEVEIRNVSAIAKDGLSINARELSGGFVVDVRYNRQAGIQQVRADLNNVFSIALKSDEVGFLTKPNVDGTISLLAIQTKPVDK
jgi:hypothetical protein